MTSPPPDINPYTVLSISPTATGPEIRTAYRRLALLTHPDKVPEADRAAAHTRFQALAFAYAVLSDETRRKRYDTTGSTRESAEDDADFNWKDFFAAQFDEVVSADAIRKVKEEFQGSEEEKEAVLEAYTNGKGDLDVVFEEVMLSSVLDDETRFREIIDAGIESKGVKAYRTYTAESKASKKRRRKAAAEESEEAMEYAKELGIYDDLFGDGKEEDASALEALIKKRQEGRMEGLFVGLEEKYSGGSKKRRLPGEPTEEEFAAAQAKLFGGKSNVKTRASKRAKR